MLFLRKTDETISKPPLSSNPLFLSNFFQDPLPCPNFKNEIPSFILGGGGNYETHWKRHDLCPNEIKHHWKRHYSVNVIYPMVYIPNGKTWFYERLFVVVMVTDKNVMAKKIQYKRYNDSNVRNGQKNNFLKNLLCFTYRWRNDGLSKQQMHF